MEGGIQAWNGLAATGIPDFGMAYFGTAVDPEELLALAWTLEDGSRKFYSQSARLFGDEEAEHLFQELATAEEHHKSSLIELYKTFAGSKPEEDFPASLLSPGTPVDIIEGGMRLSDALQWAEGRKVSDVLELAMSLETNSYDLYIKMGRKFEDDRSRKIFDHLATDEKRHLEKLAQVLEKNV
jgi:rubrerythrin